MDDNFVLYEVESEIIDNSGNIELLFYSLNSLYCLCFHKKQVFVIFLLLYPRMVTINCLLSTKLACYLDHFFPFIIVYYYAYEI